MSDPWAFGWTQVFTLIGFALTAGIAYLGFRSFERWRREKIEEKRIDIAVETAALAYESKYVFENIRSPMSFAHELRDVPKWDGETDNEWENRKPFAVTLMRIDRHKDFFERLFKVQPRFMALFGAETEATFMRCHQARRFIEVSAGMLMRTVNQPGGWNENRQRQRDQWECDIWEGNDEAVEGVPQARRVTEGLTSFRQELSKIRLPILKGATSTEATSNFLFRIFRN